MAVAWLFQKMSVFLLILSFVSVVTADDGYVITNTSYGAIRGWVDNSPSVPVTKFFGIPFAKSPIGSLRFKPPVNPDRWDGVRDALHFGNECVQGDLLGGPNHPPRGEDCLFLNVYTTSPQENKQGALPVMVFIHGGGYVLGSGSQYDVTSLATKGVILVSFNYRLGPFGFMSTGDDVMPGNYGMLDQVAALKWVQENIAHFGGDPNAVTIFGQSAGAGSVALLLLSPLAQGLFQRGITESGAANALWGFAHPGNRVSPRMLARLVGVMLDCDQLDNTTQLMDCLQRVDADTLFNVSSSVEAAVSAGTIWNPRVETTFGFLPDKPSNLLSRGEINHVDTIRGFNSDEIGVYYALMPDNTTDEVFKSTLMKSLSTQIFSQFTRLDLNKLINFISSTYFSWSDSKDVIKNKIGEATDDVYMIGPTVKEMDMFIPSASEKKHYLYEFNHLPSFKKATNPPGVIAAHGDELTFVFNVSSKALTFDSQGLYSGTPDASDIQVSDQMMEMWTNFAKTGDPTSTVPTGAVTWKPYSLSTPNYLLIQEDSELKLWSSPRAMQLFDKVLEMLDGFKPQGGTTHIEG